MTARAITRVLGAAAIVAAAFTDWTASSDLGHTGSALDVPARFLWSDAAVVSSFSLGHLLLGFASVALAGAVWRPASPAAAGAAAGVVVMVAWYLVRFSALTSLINPLRAVGVGMALALAGSLLVVGARGTPARRPMP